MLETALLENALAFALNLYCSDSPHRSLSMENRHA